MTEQVSDLPGIEGPGVAKASIPEINSLVEAYIKERDKRCKMTPIEIAAKQKLIEALHRHEAEIGRNSEGQLRYAHNDLVVLLKPGKETLKVTTEDEDED
jgi:hypothetical protein